jgi:hypothetical protein
MGGRLKTSRYCDWCGESFYSFSGGRFCSRSCQAKGVMAERDLTGANNPRYNGGLCRHKGRLMVCCRDGTVLWFSRAVVAAHIGRLLRPAEIVHHVNGDPTDDRIENLQVTTRSEHIEIHRDELLVAQGKQRRAA